MKKNIVFIEILFTFSFILVGCGSDNNNYITNETNNNVEENENNNDDDNANDNDTVKKGNENEYGAHE